MLKELLKRLRTNDPTLTQINLYDNDIDAQGLAAKAFKLFFSIFFDQSAAGVQALVEALKSNTTLKQIDLGWNNIGDRGAQVLAVACVSNN